MRSTENLNYKYFDKVSQSQFDKAIEFIAKVYCIDNPFWKFLKVELKESIEFFEGILIIVIESYW